MQWSFQLWKTTIKSCQWNEKQTKWIIMINFEWQTLFKCTSNSKKFICCTESSCSLSAGHMFPPKGPDKSEAIYGQVCEDSHSGKENTHTYFTNCSVHSRLVSLNAWLYQIINQVINKSINRLHHVHLSLTVPNIILIAHNRLCILMLVCIIVSGMLNVHVPLLLSISMLKHYCMLFT